jgi:hypothetical protein
MLVSHNLVRTSTIRTFLLETYSIVGHHLTIAYIRGNLGSRRDRSGAQLCIHLSRRPMNELTSFFFDLPYPPLPLLAPALWFRFWFILGHRCGECLARLLRWMLLSAAGSAGGCVPPVYYGFAWIPLKKRVGQLAGSFFYVPEVEYTQYIQTYHKTWHLQGASPFSHHLKATIRCGGFYGGVKSYCR